MTARVITDYRCEIAEGPLWHPADERLYWADIPNGHLYRHDPATDETERFFDGGVIGGYTIHHDGSLLLFMEGGRIARLTDGTLTTVVEEVPAESDSRFNDVIADPEGRVFAGTMPTEDRLGRLYRVNEGAEYERVLDEIALPNGLGFSPDRRTMYVAESDAYTIHAFEYDRETGEIDDRRTFVDVPEEDGKPDGLTVDEDGYVWSAQFGGGCVIRYAPDGTEVEHHDVPATNVTSLTFGGEEYADLYVTTASFEAPADEEPAGGVFVLDVGADGVPEFTSKI